MRIVDAGIEAPGSVAAGLLIGEICMGGLGQRAACAARAHGRLADLARGAQLAAGAGLPGQPVRRLEPGGEQGRDRRQEVLRARLGPGARAGRKEPLFAELGYRDRADTGVLVLEVDRPPPPVVMDKLLRDCDLQPAGADA